MRARTTRALRGLTIIISVRTGLTSSGWLTERLISMRFRVVEEATTVIVALPQKATWDSPVTQPANGV
ncbi:hypothetical protein PC118_g21601 [Phytophthora cactorum]|uniref:Uncharacterized protein n=1 Tax=Phytophthora cactorum TaxID=29920 RepID=A0A8T0YAJ0_9STRA|nr:hypothetical protein PC113_g19795 [Phytophthora cactorum]KAG2962114.1 hypothetical protein PC118_g21601 [Phytophthora cactorum]KAG2979804.1 hypothetical protein PC119_g21385 [Phytophthora cactorum]